MSEPLIIEWLKTAHPSSCILSNNKKYITCYDVCIKTGYVIRNSSGHDNYMLYITYYGHKFITKYSKGELSMDEMTAVETINQDIKITHSNDEVKLSEEKIKFFKGLIAYNNLVRTVTIVSMVYVIITVLYVTGNIFIAMAAAMLTSVPVMYLSFLLPSTIKKIFFNNEEIK